ncbi:hypothetical protein GP486_003665 [Trichoglossum hirsutum]|uniref:Uncharacterized protein n=1 Tax=Trichoglossum hirsutum TaxID=265104 RepID=A0A9P8LCU2_9PEZI|nr:hypothetical protein GP486_003665 [Trichoglossum hirsutum]
MTEPVYETWRDMLQAEKPDNVFNSLAHSPLKPLPPTRVGDWKPQLDHFDALSSSWEPVCIDRYNRSERKQRMLERQCAMAFLQANQHSGTPRAYPFLGTQHYFFGTIDATVEEVYGKDGCFDIRSTDGVFADLHRVTSMRTWTYQFFNTYSDAKSRINTLNFEMWLRLYPVVNVCLHIDEKRTMSFLCPLIYYGESSMGLVCSHTVFGIVLNRNSHDIHLLTTYRFAGVYDTSLEAKWTEMAMRMERELPPTGITQYGYVPNTCLKCSWYVNTNDNAPIHAGSSSKGGQWCVHSIAFSHYSFLVQQIEPIFALAGHPTRLSLTTWKCHISQNRKIYLCIIELGSCLGDGATNITTSLDELNRAAAPGNPQLIDFWKGTADDNAFPADDPSGTRFMQKGFCPKQPSDCRWGYTFSTTHCVHTFPEKWHTRPFDAQAFMDFSELYEFERNRRYTTFLPPGTRLASSTQDIAGLHQAGIIPVVLARTTGASQQRAAVHALGGVCYYMRECVHCAVARVQVLRRTAGLVVIFGGKAYKYWDPWV